MRKVSIAVLSAVSAVLISLGVGTVGAGAVASAAPVSPEAFLSGDPIGRYIVVLGARMNPNGSPPAILKDRLDRAAQLARSHPLNRVIVTGGNSWWLPISEASFMHFQLFLRGVPPWQVIDEHRAMSTVQNADNVVGMLSGMRASGAVIVTNGFHMQRAMNDFAVAARDEGANLDLVPAYA